MSTAQRTPDGHHVLEEVDELDGVLAVREEEVDALVDVPHVAARLVDAVLQDQLLQEHERPLVVRVLPDLPFASGKHSETLVTSPGCAVRIDHEPPVMGAAQSWWLAATDNCPKNKASDGHIRLCTHVHLSASSSNDGLKECGIRRFDGNNTVRILLEAHKLGKQPLAVTDLNIRCRTRM